MDLASPSFADGGALPARHTLDGGNLSPPLSVRGAPEGTQSFALIVEDLDSPLGLFTHWVIWNLPPDTAEVAEDVSPAAGEIGVNGFGETRYDGPAPPRGRHRLRFRLIALNTLLGATTGGDKQRLLKEARGHVLAEATLIAHVHAPA